MGCGLSNKHRYNLHQDDGLSMTTDTLGFPSVILKLSLVSLSLFKA